MSSPTPHSARSPRPPRGAPRTSSHPNASHSPRSGTHHHQKTAQNPNETDEIHALRAMYGGRLTQLKELFPNWSDEDLLTTLSEADGDVQVAAARISEGHAEQWGSVTHKKEKKHAPSSGRDSSSRDFTGARGGARGGRGGRGGGAVGSGRGTPRLPRGASNGHVGDNATTTDAGAGSATGGVDAVSKSPESATNSEHAAPPGLHQTWSTEAVTSTPAPEAYAQHTAAVGTAGWDSSATPTPNGSAAKSTPVVVSKPKLSWAQIASRQEPPKPAPPPSAPPAPAPVIAVEPPQPHREPTPPPPTDWEDPATVQNPTFDDEPQTQTDDSWQEQQAPEPTPDETAATTTNVAPEPEDHQPSTIEKQEAAASPSAPLASVAAPEPATVSTKSPLLPHATSTITTSSPPPGLGTPTLSKTSTPSLRPASVARHSARFKSDTPVVMPGNMGIPAPATPLSFGSTNLSFGASHAVEKVSMQFGSLSLGADDDVGPAPEPPAESTQVPEPAREPEPAPAPKSPVQPIQQTAPPALAPQPTASVSNANLYQTPQSQSLPSATTATQPQSQQPPQVQQQQAHTPATASATIASSHQQQQQQQQHAISPAHTHAPTQPLTLASAPTATPIPAFSAHQPTLPTHLQQPQHTPVSYAQQHTIPPHLDTAPVASPITHPAQNAYFRDTQYYTGHAGTPPTQQGPGQDLGAGAGYGAFAPLGQQAQAGHLGTFGSSGGPADYAAYGDAQRGFYDSYGQPTGFAGRNSIGHDDTTKGLPPSQQATGPLQQGPTNPNQPQNGQTPLGQAGQPPAGQGQGQYPGMAPVPYYYNLNPYWGGSYYGQTPGYPPPAQGFMKYQGPMYPPPSGGPAPPHQQTNKPPNSATGASYSTSQSHLYQQQYEDPSVGYQQSPNAADYQKQQQLYGGQGLQGFLGTQTAGSGPQMGTSTQGPRGPGSNQSPETVYGKGGYGSGANGPGTGGPENKQGQQQGVQPGVGGVGVGGVSGVGVGGRGGNLPGGPQGSQQFYPAGRYGASQPGPQQGYPHADGQAYYGYQQRGNYWSQQ